MYRHASVHTGNPQPRPQPAGPPVHVEGSIDTKDCPRCGRRAFLTPDHPQCEHCARVDLGNTGAFWVTRERVAMIRMYCEGKSLWDIAVRYKRTQYAIVCQLKSTGLFADDQRFIPASLNTRLRDGAAPRHAEHSHRAYADITLQYRRDGRPIVPAPAVRPRLVPVVVAYSTQVPTPPRIQAQAPVPSVPPPSQVAADDLTDIELPKEISVHDLTCPICLSVVYDAVMIVNCGHNFCAHCLATHQRTAAGTRCPECRGNIDQVCSDAKLRRKAKEALDLFERNNSQQRTGGTGTQTEANKPTGSQTPTASNSRSEGEGRKRGRE